MMMLNSTLGYWARRCRIVAAVKFGWANRIRRRFFQLLVLRNGEVNHLQSVRLAHEFTRAFVRVVRRDHNHASSKSV